MTTLMNVSFFILPFKDLQGAQIGTDGLKKYRKAHVFKGALEKQLYTVFFGFSFFDGVVWVS